MTVSANLTMRHCCSVPSTPASLSYQVCAVCRSTSTPPGTSTHLLQGPYQQLYLQAQLVCLEQATKEVSRMTPSMHTDRGRGVTPAHPCSPQRLCPCCISLHTAAKAALLMGQTMAVVSVPPSLAAKLPHQPRACRYSTMSATMPAHLLCSMAVSCVDRLQYARAYWTVAASHSAYH